MLASADGDLLDLLEGASGGRGVIRFLPEEPRVVPVAQIWRASERAARWFSQRCASDGSVGMVLATASSAVTALVGAWRAGLCVASLPTPGRAMPPREYQGQIEAACACVGAERLVVEDAHHLLLFNAHRVQRRDCRRRGHAYRVSDNAALAQKVARSHNRQNCFLALRIYDAQLGISRLNV